MSLYQEKANLKIKDDRSKLFIISSKEIKVTILVYGIPMFQSQ